MGNTTEFMRIVAILKEEMTFDKDINVSVFETNIRGEASHLKHGVMASFSSINWKSY